MSLSPHSMAALLLEPSQFSLDDYADQPDQTSTATIPTDKVNFSILRTIIFSRFWHVLIALVDEGYFIYGLTLVIFMTTISIILKMYNLIQTPIDTIADLFKLSLLFVGIHVGLSFIVAIYTLGRNVKYKGTSGTKKMITISNCSMSQFSDISSVLLNNYNAGNVKSNPHLNKILCRGDHGNVVVSSDTLQYKIGYTVDECHHLKAVKYINESSNNYELGSCIIITTELQNALGISMDVHLHFFGGFKEGAGKNKYNQRRRRRQPSQAPESIMSVTEHEALGYFLFTHINEQLRHEDELHLFYKQFFPIMLLTAPMDQYDQLQGIDEKVTGQHGEDEEEEDASKFTSMELRQQQILLSRLFVDLTKPLDPFLYFGFDNYTSSVNAYNIIYAILYNSYDNYRESNVTIEMKNHQIDILSDFPLYSNVSTKGNGITIINENQVQVYCHRMERIFISMDKTECIVELKANSGVCQELWALRRNLDFKVIKTIMDNSQYSRVSQNGEGSPKIDEYTSMTISNASGNSLYMTELLRQLCYILFQ